MKRFGIILLALLMAPLLAFALPGEALETETEGAFEHQSGDFRYIESEDGATIIGYKGNEANLFIPDELDGFPVLGIGDSAFKENTSIENVTIPDTVVWVGPNSFAQCTKIKFVKIGNKVKIIDKFAFNRCNGLEFVTLSDSVTNVETGAFSYCKALQSVTIGRGLEHFNGNNPFVGSVSLGEIVLPADHPTLYLKDNMLLEKAEEGVTLVLGLPAVINGVVYIPEETIFIGNDALNSCPRVTSVWCSDNVINIGTTSLANNPDLKSVVFSPNVKSIGGGAFSVCGIEEFSVPPKVTVLEHAVCADCKDLRKVTLHDNLKSIGAYAFFGCSSLEPFVIYSSVVDIGEEAFAQGPGIVLVAKGSKAEDYCRKNNIRYEYYLGQIEKD